jgi:acyl-CoA thioesterase YciA
VVSLYASVIKQGKTSVTVKVEVEAERFKEAGKKVKVTAAEVVYVAVDDSGRPVPAV